MAGGGVEGRRVPEPRNTSLLTFTPVWHPPLNRDRQSAAAATQTDTKNSRGSQSMQYGVTVKS